MTRPCPPRLLLFTVLAAVAAAADRPLDAQDLPRPEAPTAVPGDTVRLTLGPPLQRRRATVVAVAPEAITLRFRGADTAAVVPWSRVYRIEASRGRGPRRANLARGALAGALAGVTVVYLFDNDDEDLVGRLGVWSPAGAAAGTAVALSLPGPRRWREVFRPGVPALEVAADPGGPPPPPTRTSLVMQWSVIPFEVAAGRLAGSVVGVSGPTVRAGAHGLAGGRIPYVEAFYTQVAENVTNRTPAMRSFGILAGGWTSRAGAGSRLSGVAAAGIGWLAADTAAGPRCGSLGCIGNVRYGNARLVTAIADLGVFVPLLPLGPARRLGLRGDARLHVPASKKGDARASARARGEFAVGLQAEL